MQKIGFCDKYSLTQAVLSGAKSMTRRVEKGLENLEEGNFYFNRATCEICLYGEKGTIIERIKTRYKLGEIVAVAQAYKDVFSDNDLAIFDDGLEIKLSKGWNNKLFVKPDLMPHQIQMTDVSIERLQAISDDDCFKEGVLTNQFGDYWFKGFPPQKVVASMTPREAFAALINRPGVGRKGLWKSNPFVVVYEFKLVK